MCTHTCTALCKSATDASWWCRAHLLVSPCPPAPPPPSPLSPAWRWIWPPFVPSRLVCICPSFKDEKMLMKMRQTAGSSSLPAAPAPLLPSLSQKQQPLTCACCLHAHSSRDSKACLRCTWSEFQNAGHIPKIEFGFV